ncbi:MAG: hypothetical protein L0Z62_34770 [Gemmataceae bacterium]|nr:hypothetical protein [Gemmataceae bacterium]
MLRTNRQIVVAMLLAAGIAGVGAAVGTRFLAADDQEKKAREAVQAAEAQLRAAEAQLKLARANYEREKNAQLTRKEAPLRQRLQAVEWELEEVRAAGAGAFTLRLNHFRRLSVTDLPYARRIGDSVAFWNHFRRLSLTDLPVARDARVIIDGATGKLADLKAGMRLGLRLAADDLVVTAIDAHSPEELNDYLVKEVDLAKQTLSVTSAGKDFVSGLFVGDTDVYLEDTGDDGDWTALKPGMRVSLSFVASGGQLKVRLIQARK